MAVFGSCCIARWEIYIRMASQRPIDTISGVPDSLLISGRVGEGYRREGWLRGGPHRFPQGCSALFSISRGNFVVSRLRIAKCMRAVAAGLLLTGFGFCAFGELIYTLVDDFEAGFGVSRFWVKWYMNPGPEVKSSSWSIGYGEGYLDGGGNAGRLDYSLGHVLDWRNNIDLYHSFNKYGIFQCADQWDWPQQPVDLSGTIGFTFWAKATVEYGGTTRDKIRVVVSVMMPVASVGYDYHSINIDVGRKWQKFAVRFYEMSRPHWVTQCEVNPSVITGLRFQVGKFTNESINRFGDVGTLWIDEIELAGTESLQFQPPTQGGTVTAGYNREIGLVTDPDAVIPGYGEGEVLVVDDFESDEAVNANRLGGALTVVPVSGSSATGNMELRSRTGGGKALALEYNLASETADNNSVAAITYFAPGWGEQSLDLSQGSGISFLVKANEPMVLTAILQASDWKHQGVNFYLPDANWHRVVIPFESFIQPTYVAVADRIPLDPARALYFSLAVCKTTTLNPFMSSQGTLLIDDVVIGGFDGGVSVQDSYATCSTCVVGPDEEIAWYDETNSCLVDDFEDSDEINELDGNWKFQVGEGSPVELERSFVAGRTGGKALSIVYHLGRQLADNISFDAISFFAPGWGKYAIDLSSAGSGIHFLARADQPLMVRAVLQTEERKHHGVNFYLPDTAWHKVLLPFDSFGAAWAAEEDQAQALDKSLYVSLTVHRDRSANTFSLSDDGVLLLDDLMISGFTWPRDGLCVSCVSDVTSPDPTDMLLLDFEDSADSLTNSFGFPSELLVVDSSVAQVGLATNGVGRGGGGGAKVEFDLAGPLVQAQSPYVRFRTVLSNDSVVVYPEQSTGIRFDYKTDGDLDYLTVSLRTPDFDSTVGHVPQSAVPGTGGEWRMAVLPFDSLILPYGVEGEINIAESGLKEIGWHYAGHLGMGDSGSFVIDNVYFVGETNIHIVKVDTFVAAPDRVVNGGSTTLSWSISNLGDGSVYLRGGTIAQDSLVDGLDSIIVDSLAHDDTTTFVLKAVASDGTRDSATVSVVVTDAYTTALMVDPQDTVILEWDTLLITTTMLNQSGLSYRGKVDWVVTGDTGLVNTTDSTAGFASTKERRVYTVIAVARDDSTISDTTVVYIRDLDWCTQIGVPVDSEWVVRNSHACHLPSPEDSSDTSYLETVDEGLLIHHEADRGDHLWVIGSGMPLTMSEDQHYMVTFEFQDDSTRIGVTHAEDSPDTVYQIAGLEAALAVTSVHMKINCGGPAITGDDFWESGADYVSGGSVLEFDSDAGTEGIENPPPLDVYKMVRHKDHSYDFNIPNGQYTVCIHFSDQFGGDRKMDYTLEGEKLITGLNPAEEAGGVNKAVVKELQVTVSDGNGLQIECRKGEGDDVFEAGIEIFGGSGGGSGGAQIPGVNMALATVPVAVRGAISGDEFGSFRSDAILPPATETYYLVLRINLGGDPIEARDMYLRDLAVCGYSPVAVLGPPHVSKAVAARAGVRVYRKGEAGYVINVPFAGAHRIDIVGLNGSVVHSCRRQGPATHVWSARNSASGVYFIRVKSGRTTTIRRVLLVR